MRDRTRLDAGPRSRYGALGLALAGSGLLLLGPATASSAALQSTPDGETAVTAQSRGAAHQTSLAAPLSAGSVTDLVTPVAGPVLDAAALLQIATYVSSVIPAPAPPPPPALPAPVIAPPAPVPAAPKVAAPAAPRTVAPKAPKAPAAPRPAAPPAAAPAPVSAGSAYEARLLTLVNQARAQNGLAPLALNGCAQSKARSWATAQAAADSMSHQALGPVLSACHARSAGENVAYGNISADQMFSNWMNSPGHRANILNPAFNAMGNGATETASGRVYGCQVFLTV